MKKFIVALTLIVLLAAPVQATLATTIWHMKSGTGTTGDGSAGNPWFSNGQMGTASAALQPGDTLNLDAGSWTVAQINIGAAGTAQNPIRIGDYMTALPTHGGASAVTISGNYNGVNFPITAAYLVYQNITIQPTGTKNGFISPQSCTVNGCSVPNHITIDHVTVNGNSTDGCSGIGLNETDYMTISNNVIENMGSGCSSFSPSGISLYQSVNTDGTGGVHNQIYGNIISGQSYGTGTHSDGNGIIIDDGQHTQVNGGACAGAFSTCNPAYTAVTKIFNNVIYSNQGPGVQVYFSTYAEVMNNTLWKNNTGLVNTFSNNAEIRFVNALNGEADNNIAVVNRAANAWLWLGTATNVAATGNVGFGSIYASGPQAGVREDTSTGINLGTNINTDPQLTLAPTSFYPQSGSSAFNESWAYFRAFPPTLDFNQVDLGNGALGTGLITAGAMQ